MQYMLRETAERLTKVNSLPVTTPIPLLVSAVDPANPFGWAVPWPSAARTSFSRKSGHYMVFIGQRWAYWVMNHGRRIEPVHVEENLADFEQLKALFREILQRSGKRKLVIETYDGRSIGETAEGAVLRGWGAEQDREALVLWPSQLS
jgi:ATP-dependent Lhr-like helicase